MSVDHISRMSRRTAGWKNEESTEGSRMPSGCRLRAVPSSRDLPGTLNLRRF